VELGVINFGINTKEPKETTLENIPAYRDILVYINVIVYVNVHREPRFAMKQHEWLDAQPHQPPKMS